MALWIVEFASLLDLFALFGGFGYFVIVSLHFGFFLFFVHHLDVSCADLGAPS